MKSLFSTFTDTQNAPVELLRTDVNQISRGSTINHNSFWMHSMKTWKSWRFNPCASLPSKATDDRKKFHWLNTVWNNKLRPLFLELNDAQTHLSFS